MIIDSQYIKSIFFIEVINRLLKDHIRVVIYLILYFLNLTSLVILSYLWILWLLQFLG